MSNFGDESGLLWQTDVKVGRTCGKVKYHKVVPAPEGYKPPASFRPFAGHKVISLDIETRDPDLRSKGPSTYRGGGDIVGVAIGYEDGENIYYPLAHKNGSNVEGDFYGFMREQAAQFGGEIIGANLQYDLDWLYSKRVDFKAGFQPRDVQQAESLLDENKLTYKLNALSKEYLGEGKATDDLRKLYGDDYITRMEDLHAGHVALYGETDVRLPAEIYPMQREKLAQQGMSELWDMECGVISPLLKMRRAGVRIDLPTAELAYDALQVRITASQEKLKHICGRTISVDAGDDIAIAFDKAGIPYPHTDKGKPSFRRGWLEAHPSDLAREITSQRGLRKIANTFIKGYILDQQVNGRIHGQFHPLRGDEGGTVSGRFSSSNPNLQNIPARDPELGPLMRGMFIPEEDHDWGSSDWSQIEYRFLVHYAYKMRLPGAERAAKMYMGDKRTDFHALAAQISGKSRKEAKNINFGVVYGMGVATMAANLGVSHEEGARVLEEFKREMPFAHALLEICSNRAAKKGHITTVGARRRRFHLWECSPVWDTAGKYNRRVSRLELYAAKDPVAELEYDELVQAYPTSRPKRTNTHAALNALLQGSAADLMKQAMVNIDKAGLFEVLIPHSTVHDELNVSVPRTAAGKEAFREMQHMMETAIPLLVPVLADAKIGASWREAH